LSVVSEDLLDLEYFGPVSVVGELSLVTLGWSWGLIADMVVSFAQLHTAYDAHRDHFDVFILITTVNQATSLF